MDTKARKRLQKRLPADWAERARLSRGTDTAKSYPYKVIRGAIKNVEMLEFIIEMAEAEDRRKEGIRLRALGLSAQA